VGRVFGQGAGKRGIWRERVFNHVGRRKKKVCGELGGADHEKADGGGQETAGGEFIGGENKKRENGKGRFTKSGH